MSRMIHIRFLGLFVVMLTMFSMSALANNNYYSKVSTEAVGIGKVYVNYNTTTTAPNYTYTSEASSGGVKDNNQHTYYLYAEANEGAEFVGWYKNKDCTGNAISKDIPYKATIVGSDNNVSPASEKYYALFKPKNVHVLYELTEYSHGAGAGVIHSYTLSGPGKTLYYLACRESAAIYYHFYVEYSTDNENWTEAKDNQDIPDDGYKDFFSCDIPETARYVRFRLPSGGTLTKYIKNVYVPRKTYVRASSDKTAFGTVYTDERPTATFTVNYSTTNGGNVVVRSNNAHFVASSTDFVQNKTEFATTENSDGTKTFTVTYTPDPEQLGEESAVITIGDLFYTQQITLTATSQKYPTSIARGTNTTTTTTVDGTIGNAFAFSGTSTTTPSANSSDDFYYAISHTQTSSVNNGEGVISYDPATNTITGLNAGTARLTFYQKKTLKYHATSQSFDFTVTKLANNVGIALSTTELDVDGTATVQLTDVESDGALSAAYTNINYLNESQNRDGGLLSFAGNTLTAVNAGTATVTITQAETYKYVAKSTSFNVTVNKLTQTLTWDNPDLETTMQLNGTLSGNTARSNVGLTPITYESSNESAITVDATTGDLTAVGTGTSIITATQAGNYKISAVSITRRFTVFKREEAMVTTSLSESGTNSFPIGNPAITIRANATLTEGSFDIIGNSEGYVSASFDVNTNTMTISALKEGGPVTVTLTRPQDELYYAIDKSYTIQVVKPVLALSPSSTPVIDYEEYSSITLSRTLKAGYSTIALPFSTSVEELVNGRTPAYDSDDDWVAQLDIVTYSAADGYTLYFQKIAGGIITANQPYVLHLGSQVVNPTWTDLTDGINVEEAEAASIGASTGYSGYAGWVMHSNFTPNFAMAGKYGIVNSEGGLMLGSGSSAKLNAFTAYITAPQANPAPRLRVAYVDTDGTTTFIGSLPEEDLQGEPVAIYGPDGQRRSKMQRGVNIVRFADGTTRKVQY